MRGAIDYIVVGFGDNDFDGSILNSLDKPIDQGVIAVLGLVVISKDEEGNVARLAAADTGDDILISFSEKYVDEDYIDEDDALEIGDLLENGTAAGLLIIEHLWAKPMKEAILAKDGILLAEGRIHPEAAAELE